MLTAPNTSPALVQNPPGSLLAVFSSWWGDIRFEQERRVVLTLAVVLAVSAVIVTLLALRPGEKKPALDLSPAAGTVQSAPSSAPLPPSGILEQAAQLVVDGNLMGAAASLRSAELSLLRLQGILAWKNGDTATAAGKFESALAIEPASSPDLVNLAGIRLVEKNPVAAVDLLKRAHEASPDEVYVSNRYLLARIEAGDIGGVRTEVQSALAAGPQNSIAHVAFAAAALEIASGRFSNAANFLYAAQGQLPSGVFNSLLNESPIALHAARRELQPFFAPLNGQE